MNLTFYWIPIMFKINRKYSLENGVKWILFFHNISSTVLKSLYRTIWFPNWNTTFIKPLSKVKVKTFLLSTLIALNVKWVPRFMDTISQREILKRSDCTESCSSAKQLLCMLIIYNIYTNLPVNAIVIYIYISI